jgi:hypothetical protein
VALGTPILNATGGGRRAPSTPTRTTPGTMQRPVTAGPQVGGTSGGQQYTGTGPVDPALTTRQPYVQGPPAMIRDPRTGQVSPQYPTLDPGQQARWQDQEAANAYARRLATTGQTINADYDAQIAALGGQRTIAEQYYGSQRGLLREDSALDQRRLAGDMYRTVGLGRDEANSRMRAAEDAYARAARSYGNETAYIGQQRGFAGTGRDLALQFYDATKRTADQGAQSQATAKNAYMAPKLGRDYQQNTDSWTYNSGNANLQYGQTIAGLDAAQSRQDLQRDASDSQNRTDRETYTRTRSYLDSMAQDYGLRGQQMDVALRRGLAGLGYDAQRVMSQLEDAVRTRNTERLTTLSTLFQQAMTNAGQ